MSGGKVRGEVGRRGRVGVQGGCERRIEVFVKIQKKKNFFYFFLGGGSGRGVRVDVNEELKFLGKFKKKMGGGVGLGGGVRMDVNEELKFFVKIQKKKNWVGVPGGGGGRGKGSAWGGGGGGWGG